MDDDAIAQFVGITSSSNDRAAQYLQVADGDLEQAIQLFFENDGADMAAPPPPAPSTRPQPHGAQEGPITIDSDDEEGTSRSGGVGISEPSRDVEDDEAMARRLQNEMYESGGAGANAGRLGNDIDPETGVRAPIGRTTETLSGPSATWQDDPEEMRAAIAEQMASRSMRRQGQGRPGIFNQQPTPTSSIWDESGDPSSNGPSSISRREHLARATGGASETSSKSSMLAEMYRPPHELISPIRTWEGVRAHGKEEEKWILINVQDPNIFDCQVLNRDIWKDASIQATVREHFVFKQYAKSDLQAQQYVRFYFASVDSEDAYPHIAIVDPRTGEQVKVWSGSPAPKPGEFLMQLHEFLDRYSLKAFSRNPVATRKSDKKGKGKEVDKMSEEEMMQMAMKQSLGGEPRKGSGPKEEDPDVLTRDEAMVSGALNPPSAESSSRSMGGTPLSETSNHGRSPPAQVPSSSNTPLRPPPPSTTTTTTTTNGHHPTQSPAFTAIPSNAPHTEPPSTAPSTTRIQFRHSGTRVVRRFLLSDPVRRLYEWIKSEPTSPIGPGNEGKEFELICMGRNLLAAVEAEESVEGAGVGGATIMVEFVG